MVVLGAGLAGCCAALDLAQAGHDVMLLDRAPRPMLAASRHNEGKLHFGYVYAADQVLETHHLLSLGSLRFIDILERLTGVPRGMHRLSGPFTYVVPEDSAKSVEELWAYTRLVDATVAEHSAALGLNRLPESRIASQDFVRRHYSNRVRAAFRTPEIAIDPGRVSDIVTAAVYSHPNIDFRGGLGVLAADVASDGYILSLMEGEERTQIHAAGVINALWEDRIRIDRMVGLTPSSTWSQRWKATVTLDVPPKTVDLPSTTAFVGPFGDFVLYGKGRIYVSWYPECRLSMSTTATPDDVRARVQKADADKIRRKTLAGLAQIVPGVAALEHHADTTRIGGGFIMAIGDTDIDDKSSGLHQRHQIGVTSHGNWISLSTGKFCVAPMFGVEAAQALAAQLTT